MKITHRYFYTISILILPLLFNSCREMEKEKYYSTEMYINAKIYSVSNGNDIYSAMWVKNGKIYRLFRDDRAYEDEIDNEGVRVIDLKGHVVIPGIIEGHGHFMGLGEYVSGLRLSDCRSWDEVVDKTTEYADIRPEVNFVVGKGWHPSNWESNPSQTVDGYPTHHLLSAVFPEKPVVLYHSSFHALMANEAAMNMAKISRTTKDPDGGRIVRDREGNATGIFEENAMELLTRILPEEDVEMEEKRKMYARAAGEACLRNGVTTFVDAGIDFSDFEAYKEYVSDGTVPVRLWTMASASELEKEAFAEQLPFRDTLNEKLFCTGVKAFVDGALGSYGAWMIDPYHDNPDQSGQNVTDLQELEKVGQICIDKGMQYCVHAIGDRGNREMLNIFERLYEKNGVQGESLRWRMEHAQIVRSEDIKRFSELGVIPSMQAIHCPSDASFVIPRVGEELAKSGAYAWRHFIDSGSVIANGTDCPVESINPFENLYASVARKKQGMERSFLSHQSMTREEALFSVTKWNAYACYLEQFAGSLEEGKWADFVVLDTDILECPEKEIPGAGVLLTAIAGEPKYISTSFEIEK